MPLPLKTLLSRITTDAMLVRARKNSVRDRQTQAALRVDVVEGDWDDQGKTYARALYQTLAVGDRVMKFWSPTPNIATALLGIVCVAYETPPVRQLKDAPQPAQDAWQDIVKEGRLRTKAKGWERYAKAANVVITVPVVRDGDSGLELHYERFLPHHTEIVPNPQNPMGPPLAILASYAEGDEFEEGHRTVILDKTHWRYYDENGNPTKTVRHGAGVFPGTVWRLSDPVDDWWSSCVGKGVFDLTLKAAHVAARMDWVRFNQDRNLVYIASKRLKQIGVQAGAEGAMDIPIEPSEFELGVENINTPIDGFRDHISLHFRDAARLWDIPPDMIDVTFGSESIEASVNASQQHQVAKIRNNTIEWLRTSEEESAWKTALVLQGSVVGGRRHRHAAVLKPDLVARTFTIEYAKLTFVDHPKTKVEVLEGERDLGTKSTVDCRMELNPGETREEARKQVMRVAEEEAELEEIYITHNLPRHGRDRRQTIAEAQGALGGMQSGVIRNEQNDERKPGRDRSSSASGNTSAGTPDS